ncbi:MAG: hypothetical protein AAGE59_06920 [Cyanobacteria bacterium P01_F01_bin.86]
MSQQDNFGSGFLLGTLFGGVIGGVVGAVVASRIVEDRSDEETLRLEDSENRETDALGPSEEEMEVARRGLEDKIAQLNAAIDNVRQRLGGVNGYPQASEDVGKELR